MAQPPVIRERGYALDEGEREIGVRCVGVAVEGIPAQAWPSRSGPSERVSDELVQLVVPFLTETSEQLAKEFV